MNFDINLHKEQPDLFIHALVNLPAVSGSIEEKYS